MSTTKIAPWPTDRIETDGDYRSHTYLEEHIGGPLYEHQTKLPRLPVPSVDDTLSRFLPTALPLARSADEKISLKAACDAFPEQAKHLQDRLLARKSETDKENSSWLQMWWNQLGYLQVRDTVVINVSYFFHFTDDPSVGIGPGANIKRGATMLFATAKFRKLVATGQLPPETVGKAKTPLCSTPYKYMFNACRIPHKHQDSVRVYDPSRHSHCIVARKGHFFAIEFVDPESGDPLPVSVLEDQLEQCIKLADSIPSSRPTLGVLTSDNRDNWAEAREELIEKGGAAMEAALEHLESGCIMINLDDESPASRQECGVQFLTGGIKSGDNRWFDKSIQLIVCNNGKAGLCGEHSMIDGTPVVNFSGYITNITHAEAKRESPTLGGKEYHVQDIFADAIQSIDHSFVNKLHSEAWVRFRSLVDAHVLHTQSFHGFGSSFIKKSGYPPDPFVQVAMQLATYRLFGEQAGTYEATQVRTFVHGRTETTRTVSLESEAFVKAMGLWPKKDMDDVSVRERKLALLEKATVAHSKYTRLAGQAMGVDRHFFGLSMLVGEDEAAPDLFADPVFKRSKTWRVSTSQLTHPRFANWGYGEVVPDGVGLSYSIWPNACQFNVTSLKHWEWTDKLSDLLEEALLEMKELIELSESPKSKL